MQKKKLVNEKTSLSEERERVRREEWKRGWLVKATAAIVVASGDEQFGIEGPTRFGKIEGHPSLGFFFFLFFFIFFYLYIYIY